MAESKKPEAVDQHVFYKIRHRDTGLFKTGGRFDGTHSGSSYGWSKTGKAWSKAGLKGHLALLKRWTRGDPTSTLYAIPDYYEIVCFSVMGTVVPLEGILPADAIIDRSAV